MRNAFVVPKCFPRFANPRDDPHEKRTRCSIYTMDNAVSAAHFGESHGAAEKLVEIRVSKETYGDAR